MIDLDAHPKSLLTTGNPKTEKSVKHGYLTAILHLAPHMLAGFNVCGYASKGCRVGCLNKAGRGGIGLDVDGLNMYQVARIRRTRFFKRDKAAFLRQLEAEIFAHAERAESLGLKPCVRLNGTSDLPWEKIAPDLFETFAHVVFYDYTKWPLHKRGKLPPNYSLVFSLAEDNEERALQALELGANVAVVFNVAKGKPLPAVWALAGRIVPVIDGDETDLRFLDPAGVIVGLRAKGPAINDSSGFVRAA